MDPSLPKQSFGDVIDKMSILTRKVFFGEEDAVEELAYLVDCLNEMGHQGDEGEEAGEDEAGH